MGIKIEGVGLKDKTTKEENNSLGENRKRENYKIDR